MEKVENFLTVRLLMQGKEVGSIIGKVIFNNNKKKLLDSNY